MIDANTVTMALSGIVLMFVGIMSSHDNLCKGLVFSCFPICLGVTTLHFALARFMGWPV